MRFMPGSRVAAPFVALLLACAAHAVAQSPAAATVAAPASDTADPDSIVARAIARRNDALARIGHVRYEAYVKYVARDLNPKRDPARSVLFLSETHSTAYWEPRRHYQEIVDARRQSRGYGPPRSLVAVDEIAAVNRATIVLGGYASAGRGGEGRGGYERRGGGRSHSYVVPSPIGRDAFGRYDFRLLDTLTVDGRRAYRLAVIPRSSTTPLFVGTIVVADSTFDLLAMDLGLNDAVRFGSVRNLRYREVSADAGDGRWLPAQIRLSGEVRPRITAQALPREVAGVPIQGLPEEVAFEQVAALGSFSFDVGEAPPGLGEYRVIVRDDADHPDTATWDEPGAVPLTDAERAAWARSDSAERHPPALIRIGQGIGAVGEVASNPGYFHFNRVDGYYLGVAPTWRAAPGLILDAKLGYALGNRAWQYRLGGEVRLSQDQRTWVGASYGDETVSHPTLISNRYNPTFRALFARADPLDYYRERGFTMALRTKLLDLTQLELGYEDARQWSLDTLPGYSFHSTRYPPRGNPLIAPGHLRAVSATLSWDSRLMVRSGGTDFRLNPMSWTRVTAGVEVAAPSVLPDDFSYRRYQVQIERAQPLFGWGTTTISAMGGIATGWVPPQRYFTVDFGMDFLAVEGNAFSTLARTNYYGNRAAVLTVRHDFDRILFARSGLPLIRNLPFTLSVQGGLFWADFVNHVPSPADSMLATAPTPYTEVGFSLGNLTPFLSPFNFSATFAWQLSSYATRRFRFGIGLTGP
jgi:hypothetical protein